MNNAGIYPSKPFLDVDEAFLKKVMEINLNSVFWLCQHMIRARLEKGGVIINMGSIGTIMPLKQDLCHYDISKAGIMVLSRALASEFGRHGFRINVLVPGGTWTQGTKSLAKEAVKLKFNVIKSGIEYNMRTPLGRLAKPDNRTNGTSSRKRPVKLRERNANSRGRRLSLSLATFEFFFFFFFFF